MLKFHLFGTVCQFSDGGDVALRLDTIGLGDTEIDQEFFSPAFSVVATCKTCECEVARLVQDKVVASIRDSVTWKTY